MPEHLAQSLKEAVDREAVFLKAVTERDASRKPAAGAWSQKEELGHLIDSATNNHVRFVRASLIDFWKNYNLLRARRVEHLPENLMGRKCIVGESQPVTLEFLIEDYVLHMQHHLDHILERNAITQYPGAALGV